MVDIAAALHYLHSQRPALVHNDVRPPNIFLVSLTTDSGAVHAKLADYGLSRHATGSLKMGYGSMLLSSSLQHFQYLSPEVLDSRKLAGFSVAADVSRLSRPTGVCLGNESMGDSAWPWYQSPLY